MGQKRTTCEDMILIGRGTYSKVYKLDDNRVLKYISSTNDTHIPSTVIWDIAIPSSLNHRNIVKVEEVHFSKEGAYITMPLYTPLHTIDINCMYKIIHALRYMHISHIIHRDIKRDNIMMDGDEPVIIDFSMSRVGLLEKMCPNVYTGPYRMKQVYTGIYGYEADLYALGVTFFSILTGLSTWRIASLDTGSMLKRCKDFGHRGRITSLLLQMVSIDDILSDAIFEDIDEPIHTQPTYRERREVSNKEKVKIQESVIEHGVPSITLDIAISIASQIDHDITSYVNSVVAIAASIADDGFAYDIRMSVLDILVRKLKIDL